MPRLLQPFCPHQAKGTVTTCWAGTGSTSAAAGFDPCPVAQSSRSRSRPQGLPQSQANPGRMLACKTPASRPDTGLPLGLTWPWTCCWHGFLPHSSCSARLCHAGNSWITNALGQTKDLRSGSCVASSGSQFFAVMVYSTKLPLALREPPRLLTPALSACRLLFLYSRYFPGSTLLGFNGRKGGFTAPRVIGEKRHFPAL